MNMYVCIIISLSGLQLGHRILAGEKVNPSLSIHPLPLRLSSAVDRHSVAVALA